MRCVLQIKTHNDTLLSDSPAALREGDGPWPIRRQARFLTKANSVAGLTNLEAHGIDRPRYQVSAAPAGVSQGGVGFESHASPTMTGVEGRC